MTKEEAYNAMQEGLLITHTSFGEGCYIYMDSSFIMKDETGHEYEESWDQDIEMFRTGWYVFKGVSSKKKLLGITVKEEPAVNYISHINGKPCPGQARCLEFAEYNATACVFCDVNNKERIVTPTITVVDSMALLENNEYDDIINNSPIEIQQQVISGDQELVDNNHHSKLNPIAIVFIMMLIVIIGLVSFIIFK